MVVADPSIVLFATAMAVAVAGAFVAAIAFQGYRAHDSRTMLFLSIGIALITVTPAVVSYGLALAVELGDAVALIAILGANVLGLVSILYSLEAA